MTLLISIFNDNVSDARYCPTNNHLGCFSEGISNIIWSVSAMSLRNVDANIPRKSPSYEGT